MEQDAEGFLSPRIDEALCIDCGLCSKLCPVENPSYLHEAEPRCFAALASDELRRGASSSGAVFPVLAEAVLARGGAVCGAAFRKDWSVGHIVAETADELELLKNSKYVQSDMGDCFPQVKSLLEAGRPVLFSGTPCQVAGLRAFLRKDYEQLQTVDILCHGVPSPGVWHGWLKENFDLADIRDIRFRDKRGGWGGARAFAVELKDGAVPPFVREDAEAYTEAFLGGSSIRRSCGQCPFNRLPRQGDLTLGDYWGIRKVKKSLDDGLGTSIVLENSAKGRAMLEAVSARFKTLEETPLAAGIRGNHNIVGSSAISGDRETFFRIYAARGASAALRFFSRDESDCKIVNFWFSANYGANLTCYALQESLFAMGYSAKVVNYMPEKRRMGWMGSFAEEFALSHLHLTRPVPTYSALRELNAVTGTFLVGSDQVFRHEYCLGAGGPIYKLDFVEPGKKRIAASASFGTLEYDGPEQARERFRRSLGRFSAISVREQAGVDIFRGMGLEAEQIIEPVFYLPAERWHALAEAGKAEQGGVLYFSLSYKGATKEPPAASFLSKALGVPLHTQKFSKNRSVADWLDSMRKADFVVTDSFHGMCFALLFHRPFAVLSSYGHMRSRMDQILGLLGLRDRIIAPDAGEGLEVLLKPIDWAAVDAVLAAEKDRALAWLKTALEAPAPEAGESDSEEWARFWEAQASDEDGSRKKALRRLRWKVLRKFAIAAIMSNVGQREARRSFRRQYKYYKALMKKAFK